MYVCCVCCIFPAMFESWLCLFFLIHMLKAQAAQVPSGSSKTTDPKIQQATVPPTGVQVLGCQISFWVVRFGLSDVLPL